MLRLLKIGRSARKALLPTAVALTVALTAAAPARAIFIAGFSGNTQPSHTAPGPGVGGTVNFAVYDATTGGSAGDTFGTGLAGFDALFTASAGSGAFNTASRYLYVYQTVNNGPNAGAFPISTNSVQATPANITSYGTVAGTSFSTTVVGAAAGFGDPSTFSGGAAPVIVLQAGNSTPTLLLGSTSLRALFSPELTAGAKSTLWVYTSNVAPQIGVTGLIDGGTTADGRAPTAVPEPSAVALSLIGLPALMLLRRRRAGA